jgi:hypothetical protein
MRIDDIEQDLKIIRRAIEASSRYTNITARGYVFAGIFGLIGVYGTYWFLGGAKVADMSLITLGDVKILTVIWTLVFFAAVGVVMFFSWWKARKNQISAWNSLAARMLLSQVPLIAVTGIFTMAMALKGYYDLIPGLWLGIYGVILYSFSYFTGMGHKIEGLVFMVLGFIVLFVHGVVGLFLLGVGFGGIHIVSGLVRWLTRGKEQHGSESVK